MDQITSQSGRFLLNRSQRHLATSTPCPRWNWLHLVFVLGILSHAETASSAEPVLSFEHDVRPILKAYCLDCHGGSEDELKGNLDLRLKRFALHGGDSGPAIVPGDAATSLLMTRMISGEMPPTEKKVPAEKQAIIAAWINAGARALRDEPEHLPTGNEITPEEQSFWSFQPLHRPQIPEKAIPLLRPIDAFLLEKLESQGLRFAPLTDRETWIQRASADLTGLFPERTEIDESLSDPSPDAEERLLDRLLASPHYGERWGRHWLDVAGFAESDGDGTTDTVRPFAWHFRDYVIRAFNADKPFDRLLLEQLAGDELVPQPWNNLNPEQIDTLAATGFLRTVIDATQGSSDEQAPANQVVADTIKVVGSTVYGLTIGCAQCHDHRYDPISQSDYYRLRAILEPALSTANWRRPNQRLVSLYTDADRAKVAEVNAELQKLQEPLNQKQAQYVAEAFEKQLQEFPEDQRAILKEAFQTPADKRNEEQKQLVALNPKLNLSAGVLYQYNQKAADELKADQSVIDRKAAERPVEEYIPVLSEVPGQIPETKVFHRGDHRQPKHTVRPADLTIFASQGQRWEIPDPTPGANSSGRRLAWAKYLTSGQHPLVGRVLVNRVWYHHFGRGIVETLGDFGMLGVRPSHPELLDWLATELPRVDWSLKQLHREIMSSTAYRQSSIPQADLIERVQQLDGQNTLYAKFPLQRLDAESLRDRMLAAAGRLDDRLYGKSLEVEDDFVGQVVVKGDVPRRSLYVQVRRSKPLSMLTTFDAPQMLLNCERRVPSTGAPQALMLMNNEFVLKQAELVAQRAKAVRITEPELQSQITELARRYPRPLETWQFGYGGYDDAAQRTANFQVLPHFTGDAWRGGPMLPDPQIGWVILHANGGHPGDSPNFMPVRRWTAPQAGQLTLSGTFSRSAENGDGVRGRIVSSRTGLLGEWTIKTGNVETSLSSISLEAGETIDYVVDCLASVESDSFGWNVTLNLVDANGTLNNSWNSVTGFHGPLDTSASSLPEQVALAWQTIYQRWPQHDEWAAGCEFLQKQLQTLAHQPDIADRDLAALANLCQQLLSSNEFLYVD